MKSPREYQPMPSTKLFRELRSEDFRDVPVWQFLASQRPPHDESQQMRPRQDLAAIEWSDDFETRIERSGLLVATTMRLADGGELPGFFANKIRLKSDLPPTSADNIAKDLGPFFGLRPYLLLPHGPARLWMWDGRFTRKEMDSVYLALGRGPSRVFPIHMVATIPVDPRYFSEASIPSFVETVPEEQVVR